MSVSENEAAIANAVACFNQGDLDGYLAMYGDDIRFHGFTPEPLGRSALRPFYEGILGAFPSLQIVPQELFSAGDSICARATLTGTHKGEFLGVPPTGRDVELNLITVLHFRDGRCVERWTNADMLGLLVQLGARALPG